MPGDQLDFDFSASPEPPASEAASGSTGSPSGFDIEAEIAREWALPLGEKVSVQTRNPEHSITGRLELAEIPSQINCREILYLRIKDFRFDSRQVDSWQIVE